MFSAVVQSCNQQTHTYIEDWAISIHLHETILATLFSIICGLGYLMTCNGGRPNEHLLASIHTTHCASMEPQTQSYAFC